MNEFKDFGAKNTVGMISLYKASLKECRSVSKCIVIIRDVMLREHSLRGSYSRRNKVTVHEEKEIQRKRGRKRIIASGLVNNDTTMIAS